MGEWKGNIIDTYCDRPMAEKKGYLKLCDKDCKKCHALMIVRSGGLKEHNNGSK